MKILGLNKSGYYYKPRGPKPDEAEICAAIDREHLDHPAKGVVQMRDFLFAMGVTIQATARAVNTAMVTTYWMIGQRIVVEEQNGSNKAAYGEQILQKLSSALEKEFGNGFSYANLRNMRQFFLTYPDKEICYTLCSKLNWSHNRLIMRVQDSDARHYYLQEAALIITTNKAPTEWAKTLDDEVLATAILDRLLYRCEVIKLSGKSYRMGNRKTIFGNENEAADNENENFCDAGACPSITKENK